MPTTEERAFNRKVFQCTDNALLTLGAGAKESLYFQIQEKYGLKKEEFATHPAELIEDLEKILGPTGSAFVEKLVIGEIRRSFGLSNSDGTKLETVLAKARSNFLNVN